MFKFLKDGLKKAVSAITNIVKEKEEKAKEEVKEEIEGVEEKAKAGEIAEKEKKSLIERIKSKITKVEISEAEFEKVFWELERVLLENNVALEAIEKIRDELKKELVGKSVSRKEVEKEIRKTLKETLEKIMLEPFDLIAEIKKKKEPYVIVFFGINGSGKTTSIAKLAHLLLEKKLSCVLAASDTFRAASIEQLQEHADKLKVELIKHKYGADPAAVAFDAIAHAKATGIKAVLVDTAGRMHSNVNLMEEMKKICRVAKPDMRIFVGEAIVGNDAVEQAKEFSEKVGIDAIILTKADVDEKGGAAVSVSYVTKKPIIYLGTGQRYSAFEEFDKKKIIESLGL